MIPVQLTKLDCLSPWETGQVGSALILASFSVDVRGEDLAFRVSGHLFGLEGVMCRRLVIGGVRLGGLQA